jgi:hypothetical protein
MQEELYKRLHAPELGPCVCSQVRRLARKLFSLYDTLVRSLPLWEEAQRQFLAKIDSESMQELRKLPASTESAVTKAFPANEQKTVMRATTLKKGTCL